MKYLEHVSYFKKVNNMMNTPFKNLNLSYIHTCWGEMMAEGT